MLVLSDIGAEAMLKRYFKNVQPAGGVDLTLRLFVTDITPSDSDSASDYTEATGGGYAAKTLLSSNWTVDIYESIARAVYANQVFTFTGPLATNPSIYGCYVTDADGVLVFAEKAPSPYTPLVNDDFYIVVPSFKLSKGTPA
jgi:hypothetical protein